MTPDISVREFECIHANMVFIVEERANEFRNVLNVNDCLPLFFLLCPIPLVYFVL